MKIIEILFSSIAFSVLVQGDFIIQSSTSINVASTLVPSIETVKLDKIPTKTSSSTKASPTYSHTSPLCNIPNASLRPPPSTALPTMHQESGSKRKECIQKCRNDLGSSAPDAFGNVNMIVDGRIENRYCASVVWEERYTMCLFYDYKAEDTA